MPMNNHSIQFCKYLLLDRISKNNRAEIYKSRIIGLENFDKFIALKIFFPHLNKNEDFANNFHNNAGTSALLIHNNISQIYDFGINDDSFFTASEYFSGTNLRNILEDSIKKGIHLKLDFILFIVNCICKGLDYAHNLRYQAGSHLNIVHGGLYPDNIIITANANVKITDFGIAETSFIRSCNDTLPEKLAYLAPEQASGKRCDHRSDIFSVGVLLYEMITGKTVFNPNSNDIRNNLEQAMVQMPDNATVYLPSEIKKIICNSFTKDPNERYRSCAEMFSELEKFTKQASFQNMNKPPNSLKKLLKGINISDHRTKSSQTIKNSNYEAIINKTSIDVNSENQEAKPTKRCSRIPSSNSQKKIDDIKSVVKKKIFHIALMSCIATISILILILLIILLTPIDDHGNKNPAKIKIPANTHIINKQNEPLNLIDKAQKANQNGYYSDAIACFESAFLLNPSLKTHYKSIVYSAYVNEGLKQINSNRENALSKFRKALDYNPQGDKALFYTGVIYFLSEKSDQAKNYFRTVLEINPSHDKAHFNLGLIFLSEKQYQGATFQFTKVIESEPSYLADAYISLGITYCKMGKFNLAQDLFATGIELGCSDKNVANLVDILNQKLSRKNREDKKQDVIHTVRMGETLSVISQRYTGTMNNWKTICKYNNLHNNLLYLGQQLKIPSAMILSDAYPSPEPSDNNQTTTLESDSLKNKVNKIRPFSPKM